MDIIINNDFNGCLSVKASGKLDIDTAAEYGMKIKDALEDNDNINQLILDFSEINYIASIGLRILLELFQHMSKQGSLKIINVQEPVLNVLKMTGFDKFLNIS